MKNIEIVSASAGTGKTHTITEDLVAHIGNGTATPAKIVATTFTKKAAAELQKRARQCLIQKSDELRLAGDLQAADQLSMHARNLQAARIGTIHSVCLGLIEDFAFAAGLAPGLRILDSDENENLLEKVLSEVLTDEEIRVSDELGRRMVEFDWKASVLKMIGEARSNAISAADLRAHGARSRDGIAELVDVADCQPEAVDDALQHALRRFLAEVPPDNTAVGLKQTVRTVHHALALLSQSNLPWSTWVKLGKQKPGKSLAPAYRSVVDAAAAHARHPRLLADMQRAAALVHEIAARTLDAYQREMAAQGLCDYVDLELRALGLLERGDVCELLAGQIDLLLVDEFQDTSPIQLEIFIRLARLAKEAIWVGDQKQAIYAFRGADPALMVALLERFAEKRAPRILSESWRSMPALVELTSKLFVPAFADHGIGKEYVEIRAASAQQWPPAFGPVLERWQLEATNVDNDALALAACTRALLEDPEQRVRDRKTGVPRGLEPGDLAILCRSNDTASKVAEALGREGIVADTPRPGLESSSEVLVALAAFRLLLDPGDRLARAALARYLVDPDKPQAWFDALLVDVREPFAEIAELRALRSARDIALPGSATAAFDLALEAVGLLEICRRWGDAEARLRNLECLRGLAHRHEQAYLQRGRALAPVGLLLHLEGLVGEDQAPRSGSRAVHVGTWHSAKGLEWPVVVLYELHQGPRDSALGVHVMPCEGGFDVDAPLADRWLRYWPWPYQKANNKLPLNASLDARAETKRIEQQSIEQELRLLYVGWTRARDRVVLAARPGKLCDGSLGMIPGLSEDGDRIIFDGEELECHLRVGVPGEARVAKCEPSSGPVERSLRDHPPALRSPSQVAGDTEGEALEVVSLGERLELASGADMRLVGEALHAFLACDDPKFDAAFRRDLAREQFERYGVVAALSAEDCLIASDRLREWVEKEWPGAVWRREWPVLRKDENGTLVRGAVDLVLEVQGGFVVIDHKTFAGSVAEGVERARGYAPQVGEYAQGVCGDGGGQVLGCYVHLPVVGVVVAVGD